MDEIVGKSNKIVEELEFSLKPDSLETDISNENNLLFAREPECFDNLCNLDVAKVLVEYSNNDVQCKADLHPSSPSKCNQVDTFDCRQDLIKNGTIACHKCGELVENITLHLQIHKNVENGVTFPCNQCQASFYCTQSLSSHKKGFHVSEHFHLEDSNIKNTIPTQLKESPYNLIKPLKITAVNNCALEIDVEKPCLKRSIERLPDRTERSERLRRSNKKSSSTKQELQTDVYSNDSSLELRDRQTEFRNGDELGARITDINLAKLPKRSTRKGTNELAILCNNIGSKKTGRLKLLLPESISITPITAAVATTSSKIEPKRPQSTANSSPKLVGGQRLRTKRNRGGTHVCNMCGVGFESYRHLSNHKYQMHTESTQCTECGKWVKEIRRHMRTVHAPVVPQNADAPTFKCECEKVFNSQSSLHVHQKYDCALLEKSECQKCGKLLGKRNFKNHMQMHENQERDVTFECDVCGKHFSAMYLLRVHRRQSHRTASGQAKYGCSMCHEQFGEYSKLRRHRVRHAKESRGEPTEPKKRGPKPKPLRSRNRFQCDKCGQGFALKRLLVTHVAICYTLRDRQLDHCTVCNVRFLTPDHPKDHICRQYQQNNFCAICGNIVKVKEMRRHLFDVHRMTDIEDEHAGYKKCHVCGEFVDELSRHLKEIHDEDLPSDNEQVPIL